MKRMLIRLFAFALLISAACPGGAEAARVAPIFNAENVPLNVSKGVTREQVARAIRRAAAGRGWTLRRTAPSKFIAKLYVRRHSATVEITFDTTEFSIIYKDSTNLRYDGRRIHRNYNSWVRNLMKDINRQAVQIEAKPVSKPPPRTAPALKGI